MYRSAVRTADDDGGNGISEYRGKAAGKLRILSAEWLGVYPYITRLEKPAGDVRRTGGTALILCIHICGMPVFVQDLFKARERVKLTIILKLMSFMW